METEKSLMPTLLKAAKGVVDCFMGTDQVMFFVRYLGGLCFFTRFE